MNENSNCGNEETLSDDHTFPMELSTFEEKGGIFHHSEHPLDESLDILEVTSPDPDEEGSLTKRNARERRRVRQINKTFGTLQQMLPLPPPPRRTRGPSVRKPSKVDILHASISYIKRLQTMLQQHHHSTSFTAVPPHFNPRVTQYIPALKLEPSLGHQVSTIPPAMPYSCSQFPTSYSSPLQVSPNYSHAQCEFLHQVADELTVGVPANESSDPLAAWLPDTPDNSWPDIRQIEELVDTDFRDLLDLPF